MWYCIFHTFKLPVHQVVVKSRCWYCHQGRQDSQEAAQNHVCPPENSLDGVIPYAANRTQSADVCVAHEHHLVVQEQRPEARTPPDDQHHQAEVAVQALWHQESRRNRQELGGVEYQVGYGHHG